MEHVLSWLKQVLRPEEEQAPLSPKDRAVLQHERRRLEREIRRLRRALTGAECRGCVNAPVNKNAIRVSKRKRALEQRMEEIDARLAS